MRRKVVILFLLLIVSGLAGPLRPGRAAPSATNVIQNPSFEQGQFPCSQVSQQCPTNWDFATCEGVPNATVNLDSSQHTDGTHSARISTNNIMPVGCFPGNYTGRTVGFSQFRTRTTGNVGYNFTSLTNDPAAFSFWFQLQPYNVSAGMAGFEVRIFGAEALSELDYVINPDPSLGQFQNSTNTHSLLFYGYQYGQWYHFSRNLRADWMAPMGTANTPLNLNYNLTLIQFQGFATRTGSTLKSETYWIDDVRAYVGPGPIATPTNNTPRVEIWNPLVHSNNITDPTPSSPSIFPVGSFFEALVNVTGAPPLGAFDIWINYNITVGPNVLQLAPGAAATGGGLFDTANIPTGCTLSFLANDIDSPPGFIHVALTLVSSASAPPEGCYTQSGTGTLLTLTFQVVGIGAGSIDILQGNANGRNPSTLIGKGATGGDVIPFDAFDAYFRNKPGIPPTPSFTFQPARPVLGNTVTFNATLSRDSDSSSGSHNGIGTTEPVIYDGDNSRTYTGGDNSILGVAPPLGTALKRDANILFWDRNNNQRWDPGESLVYSTDGGITFSSVDLVVNGTAPPLGTSLTVDTKIRYVDTHLNGIWDNGFVWDFGDGSALEPGSIAQHLFVVSGIIPAAGTFSVKLVTFDSDDGLPKPEIRLVVVSLGIIHDIAVSLSGTPVIVIQGNSVMITATLLNRGTGDEYANLNVTLESSPTLIGRENRILLPVASSVTRTYILNTTGLAPRSYFVDAAVAIVDGSTGAIIADTNLQDNQAVFSFTLITQEQPPIPGFIVTPQSPAAGVPIRFDGTSSSDPDGSITGYAWSFGDGLTSVGSVVIHVYSQSGTYNVTLTVTDNANLQASTSQLVVVGPNPDLPPVARFTFNPTSPFVGRQVVFDASGSSDPDGFITTYYWTFGDGSFSYGLSPSYFYSQPGAYVVTLTVTDNALVQSSVSHVIMVRPLATHDVGIVSVQPYPQVAVSSQTVGISVGVINNGNSPETVDITAYYGAHVAGSIQGIHLSQISYINYYNIQWDTTGVPPGNYTISATVFLASDENPSDNTLTDGNVTILPPPSLAASPTSGPPGTQVQIQGSNFPRTDYGPVQVLVTFDDQLVGFTSSRNGTFTFTFNIPLSQSGPHTIKALDNSGANARVAFLVTTPSAPSRIDITVSPGTLYFPGDTAVIYIQTRINGQPTTVSSLQIILTRPNGSNVSLTPVPVTVGEWKATYSVPASGATGTYSVQVKAHQPGLLDGFALSGFEVKPTWLQGNASKLALAASVIGGLSVLGLAWRRGYFGRKKDNAPFL